MEEKNQKRESPEIENRRSSFFFIPGAPTIYGTIGVCHLFRSYTFIFPIRNTHARRLLSKNVNVLCRSYIILAVSLNCSTPMVLVRHIFTTLQYTFKTLPELFPRNKYSLCIVSSARAR